MKRLADGDQKKLSEADLLEYLSGSDERQVGHRSEAESASGERFFAALRMTHMHASGP